MATALQSSFHETESLSGVSSSLLESGLGRSDTGLLCLELNRFAISALGLGILCQVPVSLLSDERHGDGCPDKGVTQPAQPASSQPRKTTSQSPAQITDTQNHELNKIIM